MLTVQQWKLSSVSSHTRFRISIDNHRIFILSIVILLCKIILLIGILITIFSNHWARNPSKSDRYAGYKNRCSVHVCLGENPDPTWLMDLCCLLSIINLLMESINIGIIWCFPCQLKRIDIFLGSMFILSFIIADCSIVFAIHMAFYAYHLSMGYAFYCFLLASLFSIIDWAVSLKRFISDWPDMISLTSNELLLLYESSEN